MPSNNVKIDVGELMELICGYREEAYEFEKYVALLTFSAWLSWPNSNQARIVSHARCVSAALIVQRLAAGSFKLPKEERGRAIASIGARILHPAAAAEAIVTPPIDGRFHAEMEYWAYSMEYASSIVAFILRCPLEQKPSLNKALFFIDEGGFADESGAGKVSPSTSKISWVGHAVASPFAFAEDYCELVISDLAPDGKETISRAMRLFRDVAKLRAYFGTALYLQDAFLRRLDPSSRQRFEFVKFPSSILPLPTEIEPLTPEQMNILRSYRAPKQI